MKSIGLNIIMLGPDIHANGGIAFVVNEYLKAGIDKKVNLRFIPTYCDGNIGIKFLIFLSSLFQLFYFSIGLKKNYCAYSCISKW